MTLADDYWEFRLSTDHLRSLWQGDLTHLEEWEDLSPEGMERRRRSLEEFARRAEGEMADAPRSATLETVRATAAATSDQLRWRNQLELVNHEIGLHSLLLTFLPRYPLVTAEHGERYLEKLHRVPGMLEQLESSLREGAREEVVAVRRSMEGTADAIERQLARPATEDPLVGQQPPLEMEGTLARTWRGRLEAAVADEVRPSLASFAHFLRHELAPEGRPDDRAGICHLPAGAEHYERLVRAFTTLDVSPEEVHRTGLEQVERLEQEYRDLAGPILGTDSLGEIYERLRADPELRYENGATIVAHATAALAKAEAAMGDWFGLLPAAPCVASEIEQGALAFYSRPAPDGSKPGTFFFNTSDPSAWRTFQLEAVTFHEGVPGHHLQIALAQEIADLHPLHKELYIAAFNEGWGLYSERLSDEMGLYGSDLDRLGMLTADSMRACRLVVDTGMHALGWSRDQAIQYMVSHAPLSSRQVEGEIDRYIGDPGQALGYMMGRLEIDRLRAETEARLGTEFDLSRFHDVVLGHGSVPLATLRWRVETLV